MHSAHMHGPGTTHAFWRVVYRPWVLLCIAWFVCIMPGCRVVVGEDCVDIIGIEGQIFNSCIDSVPPEPITHQETLVSDTTITITWTPSGSDDVAEIRMTWSSEHDPEEHAKTMDADSIATTITELHPYTEYTVRINTVDASGNVSSTAEITATTAASLLFTDAPSFSSAETPGSTVGQVSAIVNASNNTITIASYEIIANSDDDSALFAIDSQTGEITVGDMTLNPHASYSFTVRATSIQGISTTTTVTVAPHDTTAPAPITALRADAVAGTSDILLNWTDSISADVRHVRITWQYQDGSGGTGGPILVPQGTQSATISSLESDTEYTFTLVAEDTSADAFGDPTPNVSPAEQITVRTADITIPDPISALRADAVAGTSDILLTWTDSISTDVRHVRITWQHQDGSGGTGGPILVPPGTQSATISSLESDTEYTFTLVAEDTSVDAFGNPTPNVSPAEQITVRTADITIPDPISALHADAGAGTSDILLSWTDSISTDVRHVRITWHYQDGSGGTGGPILVPPGTQSATISTLDSEQEYTFTLVAEDGTHTSAAQIVTITTGDTTAPDSVTMLRGTADRDGTSIDLSWNGSYSTDVASVTVAWALSGTPDIIGSTPASTSSGSVVHTITDLTPYTLYHIRVIVTDAAGNARTRSISIRTAANRIDRDGDSLIDINTLTKLHNMRYNLAGTSYKESTSDDGILCGRSADTTCIGYELRKSMTFDSDGDVRTYNTASYKLDRDDSQAPYFSITGSGSGGWSPIGNRNTPFSAIFEGNGFYIRGLAVRRNTEYVGMFGYTHSSAVIRNIRLTNNLADYTGDNDGYIYVGGLVAYNNGTITNSSTGGPADGGNSDYDRVGGLVGANYGTISTSRTAGNSAGGSGSYDRVGGLAGINYGTIITSRTTGNSAGGDGNHDRVGGLVGYHRGTIISSNASGTVDGGNGTHDNVGGLVGHNDDHISASYATGAVRGGNGIDTIGGLVGFNTGTVVANYATGTVNGGNDDREQVGGLIGTNYGAVIANYATGSVNGGNGNREQVGGLIGYNAFNALAVVANYAAGTVDGGDGIDIVGGLVGENRSTITASYATGMVTGADDPDVVGGLAGYNGGTITASYAIGTVSGGNSSDAVGALAGHNANGTADLPYGSITGHGTVVSSYGFGRLRRNEIDGTDGSSDRPTGAGGTGTGIAGARPLVPFGASSYRAVPAIWNRARNNTRHAWNMGSTNQAPVLRYADYDGSGTTYGCGSSSTATIVIPDTVPSPNGPITVVCGTTLLPGQRQ